MISFAKNNFNSPACEKLAQGPLTNLFAQLGTNSETIQVSQTFSNEMVYRIEALNVFIGGAPSALTSRMHKLFDILCIEFTRNNSYRSPNPDTLDRGVVISLAQCIKLFGLSESKSSKDRLRVQIKEHLKTLSAISFQWIKDGKGNENKHFSLKARLCDRAELKGGRIHFTFSRALAGYINNAYIMCYPLSLLQTDEHNPNAYFLGRKLALHYSNANNQKRETNTTLSVKSLLSVCPNIPSYETVGAKGRQYSQLIVEPFEKGLDALPFICWEYRGREGRSPSYSDFLNCYICFNYRAETTKAGWTVPLYPPKSA